MGLGSPRGSSMGRTGGLREAKGGPRCVVAVGMASLEVWGELGVAWVVGQRRPRGDLPQCHPEEIQIQEASSGELGLLPE